MLEQSTALAVMNYGVRVIDEEPIDFYSVSLEAHVDKVAKEVASLKDENAALHAKIARAIHSAAYKFPDLAARLRKKTNEIADATGQPHVAPNVDPFTNRDEDANIQEEMQVEEMQALEARDEAMQGLKSTPDGKTLEKECKRLFRYISSKTHPDKSKDRSLHDAFRMARNALRSLDLPMLVSLEVQVRDYLRLRKKNKNFQDFLKMRLRMHEAAKRRAIQENGDIRTSIQYRVFRAIDVGDPLHIQRAAYRELVTNICNGMENHLNELRAKYEEESMFRPTGAEHPQTFT